MRSAVRTTLLGFLLGLVGVGGIILASLLGDYGGGDTRAPWAAPVFVLAILVVIAGVGVFLSGSIMLILEIVARSQFTR